ncbi:MAG: cytochrome-c peroxidase [Saprospiraceae bacterium]|nr:cytochrome-c peroxidase [Saprospiraceae bacterium]
MKTYGIIKKTLLFFGLTVFFSCQEDRDTLQMRYPGYFPEPEYTFGNNVLTSEGFVLGKKLFYDPILSKDSTVSCASCHAQEHAFADHGTALSVGIGGKMGSRNSPAIVNAAWQTSFMWDGGINHIEIMSFAPITNEVEMAEDMNHIIQKLSRNEKYKSSFQAVFGKPIIESQQVFYALTQYMAMLISDDSKYDRVKQGKSAYNEEESVGYSLFIQKCVTCHPEPLFTDYSFRNTGIGSKSNDTGRYKITLDDRDVHKFKVPSLRNVALTYPYMHDGSIRNLRSVLDHYSEGIRESDQLDPSLYKNGKPGIFLTEDEKDKLISFLNTLTDFTFTTNPLFAK